MHCCITSCKSLLCWPTSVCWYCFYQCHCHIIHKSTQCMPPSWNWYFTVTFRAFQTCHTTWPCHWYDRWVVVPVFVLFPWLCQYRIQCWTHYKHYSIGTAGTNGYLWESKYHWTTIGHDHRNSLFEGLTIDLTQPFISHWIRPVRGPILMILLYNLSPYPPYPEIPWLSVDLTRAWGICYLERKHPKTHASQNMLHDHECRDAECVNYQK